MEELRHTGTPKFIKDGIELNCFLDGGRPETRAMTGFEGREIWLVECTGPVARWRVLGRTELLPLPTPFRKRLIQKSSPMRTTNEGRTARRVRHREECIDERGSRRREERISEIGSRQRGNRREGRAEEKTEVMGEEQSEESSKSTRKSDFS